MKKYSIILTVMITLVASMLLLAQIENKQRTDNQNFWSVYFVNPLGNNNDFVIENKTPNTQTFHYEITSNEDSPDSVDVTIEKNTTKTIEIKETKKPITITTTLDKDKKEIYKK